jgi:hypothetical protein
MVNSPILKIDYVYCVIPSSQKDLSKEDVISFNIIHACLTNICLRV